MSDPLESSFDRFTPPGDIPDAAYWGANGTLADAVRRRDAARAQDAADERKMRGYQASHPAGRGWVPQSRNLGIPGERAWPCHSYNGVEYEFPGGTPDDFVARLGGSEVFTRERRVRFLDHLAFKGNVRAAAALVNVSHETAYRKRRQDAQFAALWDAALVHARAYGESQLATRALDGVEVAIVRNGEIVGYVTKHDPRLLLAHMARLDKRAESDSAEAEAARALAGRFDEQLAAYAGHEVPDGFADAAGLWDEDRDEPEDGADEARRLPTLREYVAWFASEAIEGVDPEDHDRVWAEACEQAGAEWDEWHRAALARVEGIIAPGEGDEVPADLPYEIKSVPPRHGEGDHPQGGGGGSPKAPRQYEGPLHPAASRRGPPPRAGEELAAAATPRIPAASNRVTPVNPSLTLRARMMAGTGTLSAARTHL